MPAKERQPEQVVERKERNSHKQDPKPVEADTAPPCKHKPCAVVCPPGQTLDNEKCVATPVRARSNTAQQQCEPGFEWNGGACRPVTESAKGCPAGETWDGLTCVNCAMLQTSAANLAAEARVAKMDMEIACSQNPGGQQCQAAALSHNGAVQRYRLA